MVAAARGADVVLNAVVGFAGLPVTMAALEAGKRLALANKESLIAGAPVVQKARRTPGAEIVPVDSEHCALHQCLRRRARRDRRGPAAAHRVGRPVPRLAGRAAARRSPSPTRWPTRRGRWARRSPSTRSTLMNKGLEVIEAHELFGIDYDRIDVVVHPQSIVHSMVELRDGSTLAQLSNPDMRLPIGYALGWPDRARRRRSARSTGPSRPDADLRAARPRRLPLHRPGLRGGPARRLGPGLAQRGQRGRGRGVPGRRLPWGGIADVVAETLEGVGGRPGRPGRSGAGGRRRGPGPGPPGPGPTPGPGWRPVALRLR